MDGERKGAVLDALTTEHYVLQSAAGTAISESGARATGFVLTVSSSMVAIGFTVGNETAFWPFVSAVLPLLFGLGVATTVRLVENGVQGLMFQQAIARIRAFYRTLDEDHARYFGKYSRHENPAEATEALAMLATRTRPEIVSIAATTALITAAIGGIAVALLVVRIAGTDRVAVAYAIGAVVVGILMTCFFAFERSRYRDVL
ncbi:hypothetical protein FB561_3983 [Kribbella amoyensis]|uniref:Uncharacterized protein n=1 Tax=Kribbella amoyensis TaxID=996641 RepID=A0A561BVG7_9ACTN|nr:hypothetical protein [Kribbella amoyensis]TWD82837.1 hypothetical protein FB561_3983 [Kribbella amoyensis]